MPARCGNSVSRGTARDQGFARTLPVIWTSGFAETRSGSSVIDLTRASGLHGTARSWAQCASSVIQPQALGHWRRRLEALSAPCHRNDLWQASVATPQRPGRRLASFARAEGKLADSGSARSGGDGQSAGKMRTDLPEDGEDKFGGRMGAQKLKAKPNDRRYGRVRLGQEPVEVAVERHAGSTFLFGALHDRGVGGGREPDLLSVDRVYACASEKPCASQRQPLIQKQLVHLATGYETKSRISMRSSKLAAAKASACLRSSSSNDG